MLQLGLGDGVAFERCGCGIGDVVGKFHPHGDRSVYDPWFAPRSISLSATPMYGQASLDNVGADNQAATRYYTRAASSATMTITLQVAQ